MTSSNLRLLALVINLLLKDSSVFAAPIPNDTNAEPVLSLLSDRSSLVGFVGDTNQRGTYSLVISCLLTLVLCVWSALHLNVPHPDDTIWYRFWVNARWILTGVYAPELVVFTAWRQWSSARILGRKVMENHVQSDEPTAKSYPQWTMVHSFFACTGGFAFEFDEGRKHKHPPFLPPGCPQRLTLTARGVAFISACGHLPTVSRAEIMDKSKANTLAKSLVIIQASWLLIQVIGRLIAHLPVTLLEVNTVAHVLCAFLMYAMWWNKPLAPNEPFILKGDWTEPLCAFMFMTSEMSGLVDEKSLRSQTSIKTMFAFLHLYSKVPEIELLSLRRHSWKTLAKTTPMVTPVNVTSQDPNDAGVHGEQEDPFSSQRQLHGSFSAAQPSCLTKLRKRRLEKAAGTAFFERRPRVEFHGFNNESVDDSKRRRWELAAAAIRDYPDITERFLLLSHEDNTCLHLAPEELLVARVQNWPWDDLLRDVGGLVVGLVLWLANFGYGAVHVTAWNDHFPTAAEKWLWRSSAVYIGFCGGLWIILNYVAQAYRPLNEFWEKWMDGEKTVWQNFLLGIPVVVCGASLLFARAFLVVEAFVSVRELPASAYMTPSWSQVFPHF
ncbi:MAG: hypothetical protein Q9219_003299 [cf. Caloplaca sp. 3 TL-2023]